MSQTDNLESKKQQAKKLMNKLPGQTVTLWLFLGGDNLVEEESKQLWEYIESLKGESQ